MGFHYRVYDNFRPYFITTTVIEWVDIFTRPTQKQVIVESLLYAQHHKGLEIFAWCLMPSHLHMIVRASEGFNLPAIIRDFKKYTSKKIVKQVIEEPESRRDWLLQKYRTAALHHPKCHQYKVWQDGYYPIELHSPEFVLQKLKYIHNNPVEACIVSNPCEYLHSSARNYNDQKGLIEVIPV
jgi:putative transposase